MAEESPNIVILDRRIEPAELSRGRDACIEYTSLINIRPSQGNRSMQIEDPAIRERVRDITFALVGEGEPLE